MKTVLLLMSAGTNLIIRPWLNVKLKGFLLWVELEHQEQINQKLER